MSTKKHLIQAAGVMGGLTLLSRILGMGRDIVSANFFGTSWQWDAFIYAFMLPNFFRRLVGEGALSSAFVPVYNETLEQKGKEAAFRFANVTGTMLVGLFVAFLLVLEVLLTFLLKWEGLRLSPTLYLAADLLRIFFPYLWLMSLFALGMGILNSHKHFFAPAAGPSLLNVFWIAGLFWVVPYLSQEMTAQIKWLAVILFISGFFQILSELPPLLKLGFRFRWVWDFYSAEFQRMLGLLTPAVLGFAVMQINILVDMTLGLLIGPGANSSLWYGNRLMQFPLALFAIGTGTALLPTLASQTARGEFEPVKRTLSFALRGVAFIVFPASVGLIVLKTPIVKLLFERGAFDAESTARTAAVLFAYSLGLFAYSAQKLLTAGFYAAQDTKTPVKISVIALLSNIVFNLILMGPLKEMGLALATSISGILQIILLFWFYQRKVLPLDLKGIFGSWLKILAASLSMGWVSLQAYDLLSRYFPGEDLISFGVVVFGSILMGCIAYGLLCFVFRVQEMHRILSIIAEKLKIKLHLPVVRGRRGK